MMEKQTLWVFSEHRYSLGDFFIQSKIFTTRNMALRYLNMRLWKFTGRNIDEMQSLLQTEPETEHGWCGTCSRSSVHVEQVNGHEIELEYYATVRSARVMTDTPPMLTREYESRRT